MNNNVAFTTSVMAATHKHRPTTIKRYYNNQCTSVIYCADCHQRLENYIEQLNDEEEEYLITSCNRTVS